MDKDKIYRILKIICESIEKEEFEWRLDGSVNLLIQGITDVNPRDLDIRTWDEGIEAFRKNLKRYIIQDSYNEEKKAHSLILNILDEEIEINYYLEWNEDKLFKPKEINWEGLKLKCLPLIEAENFYRNIGHIEAADKLRNFLSSNQ